MHRFYCQDSNLKEQNLCLSDPAEIHHLKDVLRLKPGQSVNLFNEKGEEVMATISEILKDRVILKCKEVLSHRAAKNIMVTLACAMPKKAKMESIIEKCTELGVDAIYPMMTQRTEVKIPRDRQTAKLRRYQSVALTAVKQCRRPTLPRIHPFGTLREALGLMDNKTLGLIACLQGERQRLWDILYRVPSYAKIVFYIGPEGDFTDEEMALAQEAGCIPITLGPNVLKVDTAAITVIALCRLFFYS